MVKTRAQEYLKKLGFQRFLCFTLAGHGDTAYLNAMKVVYLQAPSLQLKVARRGAALRPSETVKLTPARLRPRR